MKYKLKPIDIDLPNPVFSTTDAARMLGFFKADGSPNPRAITDYYNRGEVFRHGTEIMRIGKHIRVDVTRYRNRIEKEQKISRIV